MLSAPGDPSSRQEEEMNAIQVTAPLTIHEGKLEEFKELAAQCMRSVRERDSGTLQYDWFFSDTQTECVVRETYKDSVAVLEHIANLGATLEAILGVCDMPLKSMDLPPPTLSRLRSA
jgi:quinol monooxygenase YgiN